ncbi:hypothetical protein ACP4OV_006945 [Aristida adscensionis]
MSSGGDTVNTGDRRRRRRRVLFFPLPYQGHTNPMLHLAGVLHARGFAVTVFHAHFSAPDPSRHPAAFDFVPVPGGEPPASSPCTVQETVRHILDLGRACEAPFRDRLAALLEQHQRQGGGDGDGDVACLVVDTHLLPLSAAARTLGVPTLALRTGSAACFRLFMQYPALCDKGYLPPQESELDAPVRELPPYRVRDLMSLDGDDGHALLREVLSRVVTAATTSSGLIINTFDALEAEELAALRRDLAVPVFDVGPVHALSPPAPAPRASSRRLLQEDGGCLEWLDAQAPASVLYISFGTLASVSGADLVETAWGVAGSGHRFLWVLRPGLVRGSPPSQPSPLPEGFDAATCGRGMVVSWAPQVEVLAHPAVAGFWTHCGWNSTLEAVCAGVPMLCRPCFGDQMGNARYVEHVWRTGLALDAELERGKVAAAVATLMASESGGDLRRRAMELKGRAEHCVSMAGSSSLNVDKLVNHILSF